MGTFDTIEVPMDMVSMDLVGPLAATSHGNRYLLTFIDHATRWVEAVPIRDQISKTILSHILSLG